MISFENFLNNYVVKSLIEVYPTKYETLAEAWYGKFCEIKYENYEKQIDINTHDLSFKEFKNLHCKTIKDFEKNSYARIYVDDLIKGKNETEAEYDSLYKSELEKAYKHYCESKYEWYKTSDKYGPFTCELPFDLTS
ncbi:MAG: hypothetical protein KR126chlam5_00729 [Candidatus Anoxychlamydiales bacterium]|nr:hypothetical protein [Candidatus Anoxychlamydiales bacterium]